VVVTLLGEPLAREGVGGFDESVILGGVSHAANCRI
jgi:hypothetical protein